MKLFTYRCVDDTGQRREGALRSADAKAAEKELRERGWSILSLDGESQEFEPPELILTANLTASDRARFLLKLSLLFDCGLPILKALDSSAKEEEPQVASWIENVSTMVSSGHPLSEAMRRQPAGFSSSSLAILRLGEQTGALSHLLKGLALESRRELDRASEMRSKMIYPVVQLVVASLLCFLLGTFMGPRLMSILSSLGEEQPPLTRLVSTILSPNNVVLVSCLIFAAAATLVYGWKTPAGRQFFLSLIDRTPGLRGLRRDFALVRFCRSLALMLECGFTWQHSLSLCESVEDDPLNPAIQRFREQLSEGDLPVALSGLEEFPPLFHSLLLSGYESNKVTPFLLLFANILDEKLQRRTATFLTLLEPLLLAAMGLVVGLIVIASFLPILNLVQKL